jgi:hypothetical protein
MRFRLREALRRRRLDRGDLTRMRVNRKLTSAKILGPRSRCSRCHGQRVAYHIELGRFVPCPSCNGRGPQAATVSEFLCDAADNTDLRKAA